MISGFEDIKQYIPQRDPVMMVDTIHEVTGATSRTALTITAGNIFVENGFFSEPGIIEHIAQSAAAGLGYRFKEKGETVPLGFIAAIKQLEIKRLPAVDTTVHTLVTAVNNVMDMSIVTGEVFDHEELIASCEMRIFTQK